IARAARLLAVDAKIRIVGEKIELVAKRLDDGARKVLRSRRLQVMKGLIQSGERTAVRRQARQVYGLIGVTRREGWINPDDAVLRRHGLVRHLDRAIAMEDRLKQIRRRKPGEIQQVSEWLGELPRNDNAIGQLAHVMRPGHPGLQKHGDGWRA